MFGTNIWKLGVAFPLQKTPKLLPAFLFWRCTSVEPIIDRRERNPDEFCQSVPRQARFTLIFLQPFQKAAAFNDPSTTIAGDWRAVNSTSGQSAKRQLPDRPGECCRSEIGSAYD